MKVSTVLKSDSLNETLEHFFETLGSSLMARTLLLSAKGGEFAVSEKKGRIYSDMPYWTHIFNGLMTASMLMDNDDQLIQKIKSDDLFYKIFIISFCFHDINKLYTEERLGLGEILEDSALFQKILSEWGTAEFWPEYKEYLEDIKYLILNTERQTTPLGMSLSKPSLAHNLLSRLKSYISFADAISSKEVRSVRDLYKNINYWIEQKNLPRLDLKYIQIDKNIYTGLSLLTYQSIQEILGDRIVFNLRDGFIYLDGDEINENELVQKVYEKLLVKSDKPDAIIKEAIRGQYVQGNSANLIFLEKKIDKDEFYRIIDVFTQLEARKVLKSFEISRKENNIIFKELSNFLPKRQLSKAGDAVYIEPDDYSNINEHDRKIWRSVIMLRLFCLNQGQYLNKLESLKLLISRWSEGKYSVDVLKDESGFLSKTTYSEVGGVNKNDIIKSCFFLLDFVNDLCREDRIDQLHESLIHVLDIDFEKGNMDKNNDLKSNIIRKFVKRYVYNEYDFDVNFQQTKKKICSICGAPANIELSDLNGNTFLIKSRNNTNKSLSSLNNLLNYICEFCNSENELLGKLFPKSYQSDSAIYFEYFDYIFNMNWRLFVKIISNSLTIDADSEGEIMDTGRGLIEINQNLTLTDFFNFTFINFGTSTKDQFGNIKKLLNISRSLGLKIYVCPVMTPFTQNDEMLVFETLVTPFKLLGFNKIRIHEIEKRSSQLDEIFKLKLTDKNYSSAFVLAKDPSSIFWLADRVGLNSCNYELFFNEKFNQNTMSNTKELAETLAKINILSYDSSSHEESRVIRKSLDILKDYHFRKHSSSDIKEAISGEVYKIYKGRNNSLEISHEFGEQLVSNIYCSEWKKNIPNPKQMKYWIAQFCYLYRQVSQERWNQIKQDKLDKENK